MSSCSNCTEGCIHNDCFNGCAKVVSDKCVMYTGEDVSFLDIENGDSLLIVEQAIIAFLQTVVNGTGILLDIDTEDYCELVSQYLEGLEAVTALDLFTALVKATCDLQAQLDIVVENIATIEANYDVDCLTGVSTGSGTHDILQAVITKLCSVDADLTALAANVSVNYVRISDINDYIQAYLDTLATSNRYYTRMVPYCPIPYYGSLSFFNGTGAGITGTEWEKIYICNGNNSTPDMRGRAPVGAISGVPGGAMDSAVDPGSSAFNPNYVLLTGAGANSTTLNSTQVPNHTHTATSTGTISPNPHSHTITGSTNDTGGSGAVPGANTGTTEPAGSTNSTALTVAISTSIAATTGGGQPHSNTQPVRPFYFIVYIP